MWVVIKLQIVAVTGESHECDSLLLVFSVWNTLCCLCFLGWMRAAYKSGKVLSLSLSLSLSVSTFFILVIFILFYFFMLCRLSAYVVFPLLGRVAVTSQRFPHSHM